jgi:hypothetical protein
MRRTRHIARSKRGFHFLTPQECVEQEGPNSPRVWPFFIAPSPKASVNLVESHRSEGDALAGRGAGVEIMSSEWGWGASVWIDGEYDIDRGMRVDFVFHGER